MPVIGVLTGRKNMLSLYQPERFNLAPLAGAARSGQAIFYYFSLPDIDYRTSSIGGLYFDRRRAGWQKKKFPFPAACYLRDGVPLHRMNELERFQRAASARGVRLVNSRTIFDKWEVHRILSASADLKPHLPETRLYHRHGGELQSMLRRYGGAYLKARLGRKGLQVMQVIEKPGGCYECRYFVEKPEIRRIRLAAGLTALIDRFFAGRPLIIQQPLDLINYAGNKVDLRAEMQKNGRGELEVIAVPVRVARPQSPITTHAASYRFDIFFSEMLPYQPDAMEALQAGLHALLFKIYRAVEDYYGPFGEMGIDIGLDKEGRLWLIECNSQPAKVSLMQAYDPETVTRAFENPLAYALYLASTPAAACGPGEVITNW